jgi:cell division protein FtsB
LDSLQKNYDALQAENKTLDEKIKKLRSEKIGRGAQGG